MCLWIQLKDGISSHVGIRLYKLIGGTSLITAFILGYATQIGLVLNAAYCLILSFLLMIRKNRLNSILCISVSILSGVLAGIGGGIIFGLIPVAYLATVKADG